MEWAEFHRIKAMLDGDRPDAALAQIESSRQALHDIREHIVVLEASAYERKGDLATAQRLLEEFIALEKPTFWIYFALAKYYRQSGDLEKSLQATRLAHREQGWHESIKNGYMLTHDYFSPNILNWTEWFDTLITASPIAAMEIGSWQGGSSTWLLDKIVSVRGGSLTCIDTFEGSSEHQEWLHDLHTSLEALFDDNIRRTGHAGLCTKLIGYSQDVLRGMQGRQFDFVYVDGAHEAKFVIQDAILSLALLKPGGFMLFDDYGYTFTEKPEQNSAKAIDFFTSVFGDELKVIHKEWQLLLQYST